MKGGRHLILIGLPGCGKSTVGKKLSQTLSLPFADLDEVIEKETGVNIPDFFALHGEAAFREAETAALRRCIQLPAGVIATGGGAVLREENRTLMHQHGIVLFLDRPTEDIEKTLDHAMHPTLQDTTLEKLSEVRRPLYLSCADHVIVEQKIGGAVQRCAALWRQYEVSYH